MLNGEEKPVCRILYRQSSVEINGADFATSDKRMRHPEDFRRELNRTLNVVNQKKRQEILANDEASRNAATVKRQNKPDDTNMATLRPKSPRPVGPKPDKDESIWDKLGTLGTLGRKKRIKEVQEVQTEGKYAIDSPGAPTAPEIPPEEYNLEDNEERCLIDVKAYEDSKFRDLMTVLKEWINDELASQRIIVQELAEDLYDGQVLQKLLEKLTSNKLDVPEVTQSEEGQKQKLAVVLGHCNQVLGLGRSGHNRWSVESIHSKNIVAIIHLLVALARHFRPPVRLTENVSVNVFVVKKQQGQLVTNKVRENLTTSYDDVGMRCERDAFDALFDHAPEKLQIVKKSLVTFVNKHLNKMNFEVTELETQFHDGVYLVILMGLLEGFFVPHYAFHLTPHEFDQKVHNVSFAFELMEEVGLKRPKARPEDVVNMDLKSTLRVLYNLFLKYKTIA
ncbi:beta-parvin [Cylas formicarius]|uniref:beta-parvin n=1 Tax=Cylas formicarius TaxID=197179 RepID=UPI0029585610|nr:beta-parvin [Cylas formicarius]